MQPRGLVRVVVLLGCMAAPAHATDCKPAGGVSPCLDAEALWLAQGRSGFLGIESTAVPAAHALSVGAGTSYSHRPLVLNVPSPDPEGRDVNVVRHLVTTTYTMSYAPLAGLEATLSTPFSPLQDGAGTEAITSRVSAPLPRAAVRDPRLGAAYTLRLSDVGTLRAQADITLPLGDERALAGEEGVGVAPRLTFGAVVEHVELAGSLGARVRRSVPFASVTWGSELSTALGALVHVLSRDQLNVALEGHVRNSLYDQASGGVLAPAEWLLSVQSAPFTDPGLLLQLGGGTALPLSSLDREGQTEQFAGLTSPRVRGVFVVRYTTPATP
ncbi:MAG: hypothetical protein R3B13_24305 [Polyangiaceae bacterium]